MEYIFSKYTAKATIDRGQFRLPKDLQISELNDEEFVVIQSKDNSNNALRIITQKTYEKYEKIAKPSMISFFNPSKCVFDKNWRSSFSQIHLKYLGNPSEVLMQGMKDFILVKLPDTNVNDSSIEELCEDMDNQLYGGEK